jgi:hypothetical protein
MDAVANKLGQSRDQLEQHSDTAAKVVNSQSQDANVSSPGVGATPDDVRRQVRDALRGNTAVTSTERPPGSSSNDKPAGTAVPIAARANTDAVNAGVGQQQVS